MQRQRRARASKRKREEDDTAEERPGKRVCRLAASGIAGGESGVSGSSVRTGGPGDGCGIQRFEEDLVDVIGGSSSSVPFNPSAYKFDFDVSLHGSARDTYGIVEDLMEADGLPIEDGSYSSEFEEDAVWQMMMRDPRALRRSWLNRVDLTVRDAGTNAIVMKGEAYRFRAGKAFGDFYELCDEVSGDLEKLCSIVNNSVQLKYGVHRNEVFNVFDSSYDIAYIVDISSNQRGIPLHRPELEVALCRESALRYREFFKGPFQQPNGTPDRGSAKDRSDRVSLVVLTPHPYRSDAESLCQFQERSHALLAAYRTVGFRRIGRSPYFGCSIHEPEHACYDAAAEDKESLTTEENFELAKKDNPGMPVADVLSKYLGSGIREWLDTAPPSEAQTRILEWSVALRESGRAHGM